MPNAHIRDIGSLGVLTDIDPYDLSPSAFSRGVNVRFRNKRVSRAPVFKNVTSSLLQTEPRYLAVNSPSTGFDSVYIGYLNGRVSEYASATENNRSITSYVDANSDTPYTSCFSSDVFYINREDRVPWYKRTSDTNFQALGSGWGAAWTAKILRAYEGAICAFNVTESGTAYPQRVRTSEFTTAGAVPANWDETSSTSNASRNTISDMSGPIVDANNYRDVMCIYGRKETWLMQLAPGTDAVFTYRRIFQDDAAAGAINANCSIEVEGFHYVFGPNDIWRHDTISKQSITDERNKAYIFDNINLSKARRSYVHHNAVEKTIDFYYVSGDDMIGFAGEHAEGCNRKAVFNYVSNTWSFDDLPFVCGTALANFDSSLTYASSTPLTYDTIGGSYIDQEGTVKKTCAMVGNTSAIDGLTARLYAFDNQGPGATVSSAVNTGATKPVQLMREGIDLDEVGADLYGAKLCASIYPQARLESGAAALEFAAGSTFGPNESTTWSGWQTYDGTQALSKLDFNVSGKFLGIKMRHVDYHWFTLSGFDLDLTLLADR